MSDPTPALPPSDASGAAAPPPPPTGTARSDRPQAGSAAAAADGDAAARRRRRGRRGGRNRRPGGADGAAATSPETGSERPRATGPGSPAGRRGAGAKPITGTADVELPDPPGEGRPSGRTPKIGDSRPAPAGGAGGTGGAGSSGAAGADSPAKQSGRAAKASAASAAKAAAGAPASARGASQASPDEPGKRRRRRGGRGRGGASGGAERVAGGRGQPVGSAFDDEDPIVLDEETLERRRGKERKGRPVGRYLMCVHSRPEAVQIAVLEGRNLIEHYVSRPTDDATQIHGNIYLGRVQNVLPGMEAAFVDIGTPKNAVLYRGDIQYDPEDVDEKGAPSSARIEQLLRPGQSVLCQVTKNPIGTKGARLTQEVSMAGRFVVLIPRSTTYGISKRLADDERKRLRRILDEVRPQGHGLIVRTAAEGATAEELRRDVERLQRQWQQIEALADRSRAATLLYREPTLAVRVIREEFNRDYRGVIIDDQDLFQEVRDYVDALIPELSDRVELYDDPELPIFERQHVHEQLHKALDRKVWLPSGGSLIIERTEALTVIDVNTGKNVGSSNLEDTVFANNMEAADEIARQLRLRDIGGIIVIDFIDMEIRKNREELLRSFKDALSRDKTRTQVFDVSELGLVEMTRKRVSEGLVESFSATCPTCSGRGIILDESLL